MASLRTNVRHRGDPHTCACRCLKDEGAGQRVQLCCMCLPSLPRLSSFANGLCGDVCAPVPFRPSLSITTNSIHARAQPCPDAHACSLATLSRILSGLPCSSPSLTLHQQQNKPSDPLPFNPGAFSLIGPQVLTHERPCTDLHARQHTGTGTRFGSSGSIKTCRVFAEVRARKVFCFY